VSSAPLTGCDAVPTRVTVMDKMVREFGPEEGERILREFRLEIQ